MEVAKIIRFIAALIFGFITGTVARPLVTAVRMRFYGPATPAFIDERHIPTLPRMAEAREDPTRPRMMEAREDPTRPRMMEADRRSMSDVGEHGRSHEVPVAEPPEEHLGELPPVERVA